MQAVIFDAFGTLFDVSTGGSAKKMVISNIRSCGKSVDEEMFAEEWKAFTLLILRKTACSAQSGIFLPHG